ncbi:MAG TPA: matrixin family metalloprotease [Gemmatimonadaceae bacterium]
MGRLLTVAVAGVVAAGIANCASYAAARDGVLSGTLSSSPARATLDEIMIGANGTYIGRLLADRDSTIERWSANSARPVRVWIDSSVTISGAQAAYPAAVRSAFEQWSMTGIPLTFAFVSRERDADIRVRWTDHLDQKTGSTTWRTDRGGQLTSSDIVLATHVSDGHPLDTRGMRAIALHEVGHSLGLSHSDDPRDIMAPLVRVDGLSQSDRGTIKLLYSLPTGHIR